ncbi:MAG: YbgA family protein, partial [Persicimonas sp.]
RHHFLTKLFAFAQLRRLGSEPTAAALSDFQRRHKHLLMTYDQEAMRALGATAANSDGRTRRENYEAYAERFRKALADPPAHGSYVNSLTHMYGHFKNRLGRSETTEFFSMLDEYANHRLPLYALLAVLRSWCSRFEYAYFADQSLLEPYPRQLVQMRDSGKGLDF